MIKKEFNPILIQDNLSKAFIYIIEKLEPNVTGITLEEDFQKYFYKNGLYKYIESMISLAMENIGFIEVPHFYFQRDKYFDNKKIKIFLSENHSLLNKLYNPTEEDLNNFYKNFIQELHKFHKTEN